jgi:hypothetical protein
MEESMKGTSSGLCTIQLRGLDIKNVEPGIFGLGRSDPFFEIARKNVDHAAGVVRWYVSVGTTTQGNILSHLFCVIFLLSSLNKKGILCFDRILSKII